MLRKWNISRRNYKRDRANNHYSEDKHFHRRVLGDEVGIWQIEGKWKLKRVCSINQDIIPWYLQRMRVSLLRMACKAFQDHHLPVCSVPCSSNMYFPLSGILSSLPMGQIPVYFTSLCLSITSSLVTFMSSSILAHQTLKFPFSASPSYLVYASITVFAQCWCIQSWSLLFIILYLLISSLIKMYLCPPTNSYGISSTFTCGCTHRSKKIEPPITHVPGWGQTGSLLVLSLTLWTSVLFVACFMLQFSHFWTFCWLFCCLKMHLQHRTEVLCSASVMCLAYKIHELYKLYSGMGYSTVGCELDVNSSTIYIK